MDKITAMRNFVTKLWNTGRFIVMSLQELSQEERSNLAVRQLFAADELKALPLLERWIISRCNQLIISVTAELSEHDFGTAGRAIEIFLWDEYSNWYIELSKDRIFSGNPEMAFCARRTLVYVLDSCLRLLHPFMPFVTEEIWQRLPHEGTSLMVAPWPQRGDVQPIVDTEAIEHFGSFQSTVQSIRGAREKYGVEPKVKLATTVLVGDELSKELSDERTALARLAGLNLESLKFQPWSSAAAGAADDLTVKLVVGKELEVRLPLLEMIDVEKERKRLGSQKEQLTKQLAKLQGQLGSANFTSRAKPAVVEKAKADLAERTQMLSDVTAALEKLPV
eukprot:gnl/TRDRNA2_/TRDRNA2_172736_c1_seq1.p1 gnl/TRDRNA2_/TRDRNA2_172736_c1~~gnl/TRDRNA2_/TRDRNA2_172736_c1_seq1.p1  ORF type:complete len:336 (+),score=72.90 gnl/TRDRNA2_/TRDRNA2_172736_c1_seq1:77-1084(+)